MSYVVVLKGLVSPNIGLGEAVDLFENIQQYTPYWSVSNSCISKAVYSDEKLKFNKKQSITKIHASFTYKNNLEGNAYLVIFSKVGTNCEIVAKKEYGLSSSFFNKEVSIDWDISEIILEDGKDYYLGITSPTITSYIQVSSSSNESEIKSIWYANVFQSDDEVTIGKTFTCFENVKNGSPSISVLFQKSLI